MSDTVSLPRESVHAEWVLFAIDVLPCRPRFPDGGVFRD